MEASAQYLYWHELTELRAAYEYVRLYRDRLNRHDTWLAVGRSVTGLAALGGWITTNINPHIWAGVIVFVQAAEAAVKATPLADHRQGTNELCSAFESLVITALQEWEQDIAAGRTDEGHDKEKLGASDGLKGGRGEEGTPTRTPDQSQVEKARKGGGRGLFRGPVLGGVVAWPTSRRGSVKAVCAPLQTA